MKHVRLRGPDRKLGLDLDFFRGPFTWWSTAAHQNVNHVNSGITGTF